MPEAQVRQVAVFSKDSLQFLKDIGKNNNKQWFEANKSRYQEVLQNPALEFVADASDWLEAQGLPYRGEAKKSGGAISRIYRDVRFSADKSPYHDHLLMHWTHVEGSKDKLMPGIGIRIRADEVGLGGGIYGGRTSDINRVRDAIIAHPERWNSSHKGLVLWGDSLKTAPKGYDKNHPLIEDLRLKQFMVSAPIDVSDLSGNLQQRFQNGVKLMQPFLKFIADALR